MGQDSLRAVRASKTKSEDLSLKRVSPGFGFRQRECATSRRELLCSNFFSARTKFSPGTLPRFCSRQDSRRDPGGEFFSWRDLGEYRFLGEILTEIRGGNFSREGSRRENKPPRRDPGGIPVSAGNLGGIPAGSRYPFYKGFKCLCYLFKVTLHCSFHCV